MSTEYKIGDVFQVSVHEMSHPPFLVFRSYLLEVDEWPMLFAMFIFCIDILNNDSQELSSIA